MRFQEKLRNLRSEKKISQKELAEMIGVSQTAVYQWEKGNRLPKTEQIYKIATIMNVEPSDLIGEDFVERAKEALEAVNAVPKQISKNIKKSALISHYEKLNEAGKSEAIKRVKELTYNPEYKKDISD